MQAMNSSQVLGQVQAGCLGLEKVHVFHREFLGRVRKSEVSDLVVFFEAKEHDEQKQGTC